MDKISNMLPDDFSMSTIASTILDNLTTMANDSSSPTSDEAELESGAAVQFRDDLRFWIQRVAVPLIVLIGVVGNAVTVVVLTRRRMSSSTNTYLTALAVADLLYLLGIFYLSFEHYPNIHNVGCTWYWEYYRYIIWFTDVSSAVSVWLTVSFTVERYIAVCHPLRGKVLCTEKRARRVIVLIFFLCTLATITTPFEHDVHVETSQAKNETSVYIKGTEMARNEIYKAIFYWFWAIAFVFIPLLLLGVLNSILVNTVRRSIQQRGLTEVETSSRQKQENKITMTLIAVVFLFMVCQTPQAFLLIVTYFYNPTPNSRGYFVIRGLGNIANFLVAINAASNFILYCAMSDKYKRTLILTFLPCLSNKHRRSHTFNSNIASYENSSIRIITTHS